MRPAAPAALFTLLLITGLTFAAPVNADTDSSTIFLVRHAEKVDDSEDPELSETGIDRAQALAYSLKDTGVERILSSDYRRTRDTAEPLATRLGLAVEIYDPMELESLAETLKTSGEKILVVGHSNTTPELVALLGGDPGAEIDEETEYDRLYIVTIASGNEVSSLMLRYGAH